MLAGRNVEGCLSPRGITVACLLATLLLAVQPLAGAVVYVTPGGAGNQDGTSWANAFGTIQAAVNRAAAVQPSGDEIWATAGTYNEAGTVVWASNVRAYGGFHSGDTLFSQRDLAPANASIISGGGTHRVLSMTSLVNTTVDGFTVSGGSSAAPGAGIYAFGLDATNRIANCAVSGNATTGPVDGGGFCLEQCSGVQVVSCTFNANMGGTSAGAGLNGGGGGILLGSVATLDSCSFTGNGSFGHGGGLLLTGAGTTASTLVTNCTFATNTAGTSGNNRWGGGMCVANGAAPLVTRCVFTGNSATYTGGALSIVTSAKPDVRDSKFLGNSSAGYGGGALYMQESPGETVTAFFRRCLFDANVSVQYGGAACLFGRNGMATAFNNCTFTNNQSPYGGALFLLGSSNNTTASGCTFQANTSTGGAASHGGAVYAQELGTKFTASRCYFVSNTANLYGGAVFTETQASAALSNCVFYQNTANSMLGGAILFNGLGLASTNTVMNCSFNGNKCVAGGGGGGAIRNWTGTAGSPTVITNSIFYGDTINTPAVTNELDSSGGSATVTYCEVQGGGYTTNGNFNPGTTNPYVTSGAGLLRISGVVSATTPTNKGTNTGAPTVDIVGTPRPQPTAGTVDMGAYEYENPQTTPTVQSITRSDPTAAVTNASTVLFYVTFSESVAKVSAANFSLTTTGVTGASIISAAGVGNVYTVAVNTGSGNGTIRCDYAPVGSSPANANNVVPVAYSLGEVYTIEKAGVAAPVIDAPNGGNDFSTSNPALTLSGTCAAGMSAIFVNGSSTGVAFTPGATTWSYSTTLATPFANLFSVTARSLAGNASPADSITVTFNRPPTDITLSAGSVVENQPGDTVVGTLASIDPDAGDTFTYSVLSAPGDFNVNLNGTVWELRTSRPFDFETEPAVDVTVQTRDLGGTGLTFFKTFSITVVDADEIAPYVGNVAVSGPRTVDVTFSEAMGAGIDERLNYAVSGSGKGTLALHPDAVAWVAGNTYRLTWSNGEMFNGGDITITVAGAQDPAGNVVGAPNSGTDNSGGIGTPPVITRLGLNALTVQCGTPYTDAGATASDDVDGDISGAIVAVNPVNPAVSGLYTVTYNVSDAAGNPALEVTRAVTVETDTVKPVISRNGPAAVTVECHTAYNDQGATASDNCAGDITALIVTGGNVNPNVPGVYTVTYDVGDGNGNSADQVTRSVTVQDTVKPVIALNGLALVNVECRDTYTDDGALATDDCAGNLTPGIVAVSNVNANVPGVYAVTYDVSDGNGNNADRVTRTVVVQDTVKPVITLNGPATETVECGSGYVDMGATAADTCAGDLTPLIAVNGTVNASVPGVYSVTFNVADGNGNAAAARTRTVTVEDTAGPEITVLAPSTEYVAQGSAYTPPACTALDACGGVDYTGAVLRTGSVNVNETGTYLLNYSVSDSLGNTGSASHTVVVEPVSQLVLTAVNETVAAVRGQHVRLEVQATGNMGPVLYQWKVKSPGGAFLNIDGAVAAVLDFAPVEMADAGVYLCEGTDHQKSVLSPEITLTVEPGVPAVSLAGLAALTAALGLGGTVIARRRR